MKMPIAQLLIASFRRGALVVSGGRICTGTCIALLACGGFELIAAEQPAPPNIIFIMADDLGHADLGSYGQQKIPTPHLDRLATEGLRFTQAYAGAAVCAPARCVLMTGRHTGHAWIRGNGPRIGGTVEDFGEGARRLSLRERDRTVAEALREGGYTTGIIGKWGLGEPGTAGTPNRRGFDEWYGYLNQNHAAYYYTDYLWRNQNKEPIPQNRGGRREVYTHDLFTEEALRFVRRHHERTFFLYLAYTIPHVRLEVPSLGSFANEPWSDEAKTYAAMVTRMDEDVGRLLAEIDRLGIRENSLIFFTSDNGARRLSGVDELFKSSGHLRGRKGDLYEGGIRVPMIARWPGVVPAGRTSDSPWYFADVFPTLLEIAKLPYRRQDFDGVSVLPALRGEAQPELVRRHLYWEVPDERLQQAVRRGHWKAVRAHPDQPLELYDLRSDETETTNVAKAHPRVVAELEDFLSTARTPSPHWPIGPVRK
jgi:arylsulfatase A-like enzyme